MATADEYRRQLGGMSAANRRLRQRNIELVDFLRTVFSELPADRQFAHVERYSKLIGKVK